MAYIGLNAAEGRRYLPFVWNLFLKPLADGEFFVEPWANRELRDCAEMRLGGGGDRPDEILFFAADQELTELLKETKGELYLFGAYNQVDVCQMRARGSVALVGSPLEAKQLKERFRAAIEKRVGSFSNKLSEEEVQERHRLLEAGILFSFRISTYAYRGYQRG